MNTNKVEEAYRKSKIAHAVGAGIRIEGEPKLEECKGCHRVVMVAKRRINTAYVKDEQNWMTSCEECYEETIEHYNDLWATYYGL